MSDAATALVRYEQSSPSLLAAAPSVARISYAQTPQWAETRKQLEQRLWSLRQVRQSWYAHWRQLAENILPRRMHWLFETGGNVAHRGSPINELIKDPTATQAVRICTAGMRSGLMSSSRPWFKLKAGSAGSNDLPQDARLWLDTVEATLYAIMAGSNFYTSGTDMFESLIVFGTAPQIIYEDVEDIIRCFVPLTGEYFLGIGPDQRVNTMGRLFPQTLLQLVERFGLDALGSELQLLWNNKGATLDTEFTVAHLIEPNYPLGQEGADPRMGVVGSPAEFPFREHFWLWSRATEKPLSVRPFRSKPFITPRWTVSGNDAYGRSPGMDAFPDIKQLHIMTMRQAEAIEKMVRPPMLASVAMKNQPSSILPGRITYTADPKDGFKPAFEVKPQIGEMSQLLEKIEKRVERWFFNDLFQMMEQLEGVQPRNVVEINERRGEKLQVLGPVVEGVEQELAGAVRRIYLIAKRRGLFPPPPQSLAGQPFHIDIRSMIALAQEAAVTASMERVVQVGAQMQQLFPETPPLDNIDPDAFLRKYETLTAAGASFMRDPKAVDAIRQQRAKAQQAAQQAQQAAIAAKTAGDAAGAMKDASATDVGGGLNAMQLMTGMGGMATNPGTTAGTPE